MGGVTESDGAVLLKAIDADGSGEVNWEELHLWVYGEAISAGRNGEKEDRAAIEARSAQLKAALQRMDPVRLRKSFKTFDVDGSGTINLSELFELLKVIVDPRLNEEDVKGFASLLDEDGSGEISWVEFAAFLGNAGQAEAATVLTVRQQLNKLKGRRMLRKEFSMLDSEGTGEVKVSELAKHVTKFAGGNVSKEDVDAIVKAMDKDQSGSIRWKEFKKFAMAVPRKEDEKILQDRIERLRAAIQNSSKVKIESAFQKFDNDNSGTIDLGEFEALIGHVVAQNVDPDDAENLFEEIDLDGGGAITLVEMLQYVFPGKPIQSITELRKKLLQNFSPERLRKNFSLC